VSGNATGRHAIEACDPRGVDRHGGKRRKAALRARFDRIVKRKTGFVTLDRPLVRLKLIVLKRPKSRCTPTDRRTTSAATSPGASSAPASAAISVVTAAMPFSASPKPPPSWKSRSGKTSATDSRSRAPKPSRPRGKSFSPELNHRDRHDFCPRLPQRSGSPPYWGGDSGTTNG
jgi:hypothetical protein